MELLFEATLDSLTQTAISNFTQKHLDKRENEGDSRIDVAKSTWNSKQKYYEAIFYAKSSFGAEDFIGAEGLGVDTPNGYYTVVIRFYNPETQLGQWNLSNLPQLKHSEVLSILSKVVHNCDAKFYSDDASFYWQGTWEDLDSQGLSIFKFTGEKGKGVWRDIHSSSGGLSNPKIRLTKHIAQIIRDIDLYLPKLEQILQIN